MKTSSYTAGARMAAQLADAKMGEDIVVLDVRHMTGVSDYFVIIGASSGTQLSALEGHLAVELKSHGFRVVREEGHRSDFWKVMDFGGFIVHLIHRDTREFYGLERLWQGARHVHWAATKSKRPSRVS